MIAVHHEDAALRALAENQAAIQPQAVIGAHPQFFHGLVFIPGYARLYERAVIIIYVLFGL